MVIWNFLKNKRHAFAKFLPQLIDLHFKHSHFTLWLYMFQCYLFHYHHQSLAAKYTTKRWTIHRNVYLLPHYYNIILQILWNDLGNGFLSADKIEAFVEIVFLPYSHSVYGSKWKICNQFQSGFNWICSSIPAQRTW